MNTKSNLFILKISSKKLDDNILSKIMKNNNSS